jgi:hypothetical protein
MTETHKRRWPKAGTNAWTLLKQVLLATCAQDLRFRVAENAMLSLRCSFVVAASKRHRPTNSGGNHARN